MRVVRMCRRRWVVGLWWQPLEGQGSARAQARRLARALAEPAAPEVAGERGPEPERYDAMVVRRRPPQVGFGHAGGTGAVPRHAAAAAAFAARAGERACLARFALPEGRWWVVALSRGYVLPEGDVLAEDEAGAARAFEALRELGEWDEVTDRAEPEEAAAALDVILRGARGVPQAEPVTRHVPWGRVAAVATAAVLVGAAGWSVRVLMAPEPELRIPKVASEPPPPLPALPWLSEPAPGGLLAACRAAYGETPISRRGWALEGWQCTDGSVNERWRYREGASYVALPRGAALDERRMDQAQLSRALPGAQGLGGLEDTGPRALAGRGRLSQALSEIARLAGLGVRLSWETPGSGAPPGDDPRRVPEPYVEGRFTLAGAGPLPRGLGAALSALPAAVLERVSRGADGGWRLRGRVYARREAVLERFFDAKRERDAYEARQAD